MASVMTTSNSTWVTPYTFTTGELITKTIMDTYLSAELSALKTPASFYAVIDEASNYSISSATSFADVDSTDLSATLTTGGGDLIIGFSGSWGAGGATTANIEVAVDGVGLGGDDGLVARTFGTGDHDILSFTSVVTGLSAGSHTIKLQWKQSAAVTLTLYAGAATANRDIHPRFWGCELF